MMLMTADEKIQELQQILDDKDLENEELKLKIESQQTGEASQILLEPTGASSN